MSDAFAATPNYVSQLNVNLDEVKQGLVTISVIAGIVAVAAVALPSVVEIIPEVAVVLATQDV